MTASKPETASGAIGFAGSHGMISVAAGLLLDPSRINRTIFAPADSSDGTSAAPIGPETPLTRIREFMTCRLPLYQFAKRLTKLQTGSKPLKGMKCTSTAQWLHELSWHQAPCRGRALTASCSSCEESACV